MANAQSTAILALAKTLVNAPKLNRDISMTKTKKNSMNVKIKVVPIVLHNTNVMPVKMVI